MRTLNIYSKTRNAKARIVHTIECEDSFDAAVAACDAYRATIGKTAVRIFWNWNDSAWDRRR